MGELQFALKDLVEFHEGASDTVINRSLLNVKTPFTRTGLTVRHLAASRSQSGVPSPDVFDT